MGEVHRPLRGFLVHHERIDLDHLSANTAAATTSSYTEAAPRPGVAVPSDTRGTYTVRAHHAQDADLTAGVVRPGVVGNAGVIYKETAEADATYRGWNEPNMFAGCWPIEWTSTSSWIPRSGSAMVAIPSSQKVVVIAADQLSMNGPSVWTWDPKTRAWGSRVEIDPQGTNFNRTALVVLARTERVIAFYAEPGGPVYAKFSDDSGATWTQYGRDEGAGITLDSAVNYLSIAEDRNGDLILLAMDNATGDWWQYRSADSGASFAAAASGSGLGSRPRLVRMADGRVLVLYVDQGSNEPHAIILDDAYDTLTGKTGTSIDGTNAVDSLAAAVDADGVIVAYLAQASDDAVRLAYSVDNATTWTSYTQNALSSAMASPTPENYRVALWAACWSAGECLVACALINDATSPATEGSLVGLAFGGWSTAEMRGAGVTRRTRRSYGGNANESVFLPSDGLDTQGWTLVGTTHEVAAGRFRYTTAGAACHTRVTSGTALTGGSHVVFDAAVLSLSGASDVGIAIIERATSKVEIRANTTSFWAVDLEAGTQFGSTVTIAMNSGADPVVFAVVWAADEVVTILYRRRSSSVWIVGPQKSNVMTGIGVNQRVQLGVMDAVTATVSMGFVAISESSLLTGPTDQAPYLEDFQWGKPLGPAPYPVRDQGGSEILYLSAAGGASRWNEQFSIPARHDHGLREILPQESPSPDRRWRTTGTTEQIVAFDLTGASVNTRIGTSWALGLALVATNFRLAHLDTRVNGGAWVEAGTWDSALLAGASFVRSGELVQPASSGVSANRFWAAGQLSGGTVIFDPSGTPVARRIRWNSGGGWSPGNALPPILWLDGITGSEPTSGTCDILAPGGVLVVHASTPATYRRVRLRIPASQTTAEGYYELGQMMLGSLLIPGRQWSRGFSVRETPNVLVEEDDAGTLWPDRRGEARRELTVAWQDGYDVSPMRRGPVVPYLAGAGGVGLAAADDVRWQLSGLLREARGGELPVCALMDIPRTTGMILDPSMWFPGLLSAVVQVNNVQGSEGRSEVDRIESVTVREQPWTRYDP